VGAVARRTSRESIACNEADSLARYLKLVKSDSATMERIAREEFGMVRGEKEILYRFGDAPSTSGDKPR